MNIFIGIIFSIIALAAFITLLRWIWNMDDARFERGFTIWGLGIKPHEEAIEELNQRVTTDEVEIPTSTQIKQ
jgi:hypothetical protein